MTTKFTITRMAKTIRPIVKLPPVIRRPKASITWPAPCTPSWPCDRMRRVEATFRASRNRVVTSRTVGKAVKSRGRLMNSEVIRIRMAEASEIDRRASSRKAGTGRIRRTRTETTPRASATSPRASHLIIWPGVSLCCEAPENVVSVTPQLLRRRSRPSGAPARSRPPRSTPSACCEGCGSRCRGCWRRASGCPGNAPGCR